MINRLIANVMTYARKRGLLVATVAKGQFSFLLQESLLFSFSQSISIKDLLRNYLIVDKIYLSDLFLKLKVLCLGQCFVTAQCKQPLLCLYFPCVE